MPSRAIKTKQELAGWVSALEAQPLPITVSFQRGAKRSNPQNRTIHMWYTEIAAALDANAIDVRAECKLTMGVPILRRDDESFCVTYDTVFRPLPYDTKLEMFKLLDPQITSLMSVPQLREFMDAMWAKFNDMGVRLTHPEDKKWEGAA